MVRVKEAEPEAEEQALRRARLFVVAIALLVTVCSGALAQLDIEIEGLLSSGRLSGANCKIGYIVIDAGSGMVLAEGGQSADADEQMIPASNMKLLTSAAALAVFGAEYEYETTLSYDEATNTVVVTGSGDPAFGDPKLLHKMGLDPDDVLKIWVDALVEAGVPAGAELIVDDRIFDTQRVHPTWPREQLNRWYCCEVAGLNFHTNYVSVYTYPNAPGEAPRLRLAPPAPWLDTRNRATSVDTGKHTAWAARDFETNKITINGRVRWSTDPVDVTLHDSPTHFAHLLSDRMKQAGIEPSGFRLAGLDEDVAVGKPVHVVRTSIATVLERCNADSYNLYAECLLKGIGNKITGAPGSWANGAAVMRMILLERLGTATGQGIIVADGSGMSRENRVTPRLIAEWLRAVHQDAQMREVFLGSLAAAGNSEGTLRKRFKKIDLGCKVRAKTGYLTGVSAMSGYVTNPQSGRTAIFSIITNEKPNKIPLAWIRQFEEQVVDEIDNSLMPPPPPGSPKRRTVNAGN